jgi:hypothetical protein
LNSFMGTLVSPATGNSRISQFSYRMVTTDWGADDGGSFRAGSQRMVLGREIYRQMKWTATQSDVKRRQRGAIQVTAVALLRSEHDWRQLSTSTKSLEDAECSDCCMRRLKPWEEQTRTRHLPRTMAP